MSTLRRRRPTRRRPPRRRRPPPPPLALLRGGCCRGRRRRRAGRRGAVVGARGDPGNAGGGAGGDHKSAELVGAAEIARVEAAFAQVPAYQAKLEKIQADMLPRAATASMREARRGWPRASARATRRRNPVEYSIAPVYSDSPRTLLRSSVPIITTQFSDSPAHLSPQTGGEPESAPRKASRSSGAAPRTRCARDGRTRGSRRSSSR